MNGFKRYVGLSAVLFPVVTAMVSGCGSDASTSNPQEDVKVQVDAPGAQNGTGTGSGSSTKSPTTGSGSVDAPVQDFGLYRGTWNGHELTFEPIEEATGGIKTQAFTEVDFNRFTISTTDSIAVNSGGAKCTANATNYPTTNYADGVHHPFNGGYCENHTLCALVNIENPNSKTVENIWAEIISITPAGFAGNNSDDPSSAPAGPEYGISNALGSWTYGTMSTGAAASAQWNFTLPTCDDFNFVFRLKGTLTKTSYAKSGTTNLAAGEFIDMCALGGTAVLKNAGPTAQELGIPMPFPFSLYDLTLDTTNLPLLYISASGALGIADGDPGNLPGVATGANTDFSTGYPYSIFPFWDALNTSASGVCYGVTGSAPNRKFVVTWKDATIVSAPTQTTTFSAVLNEGSDNVVFQYKSCGINAAKRGGGATVGIEGLDATTGNSVFTKVSYNNGTFLPATCLNGLKVTLTASPPSTL